jgi:hypothetical protein
MARVLFLRVGGCFRLIEVAIQRNIRVREALCAGYTSVRFAVGCIVWADLWGLGVPSAS